MVYENRQISDAFFGTGTEIEFQQKVGEIRTDFVYKTNFLINQSFTKHVLGAKNPTLTLDETIRIRKKNLENKLHRLSDFI